MPTSKSFLSIAAIVALTTALASAQPSRTRRQVPPLQPPTAETPDPTSRPVHPQTGPGASATPAKLSITEHDIAIAGQTLRYRATAGYMPIKDDSGRERASVFFIAYEKLPAPDPSKPPTTRPVTFVFNGGPGAAAVWLHLGALGPKRIAMANDLGEAPAPPYRLVDNDGTWLANTDLVFIDPVGTGYSRPAPGESGQQFYGVREDVASVADFIRIYVTKYQRWLSPKFLAGESYGTTRAAGLSEYLLDRYGISLNGIVLISTVLNFQVISGGNGNDLPYPLYLPTYSAIAWYHKKLAPQLQDQDLPKLLKEVQQFALSDYTTALARGGDLSADQRKAMIDKLSRYTGLLTAFIEKSDLRISPDAFRKQLLETDRKLVGRYDGRIVGYDLYPAAGSAEYDPSLSGYLPAYSAAFNDYVRRDLNYENEIPYEVLSDRVHPWNFSRGGGQGSGGYLNVTEDLRSAMAKTPYMKVFVAAGYFDLATPFMSVNYTFDHLNLTPALRANIIQAYYSGGHMLYHNHDALLKLKDDVAAFMHKAVSAQ